MGPARTYNPLDGAEMKAFILKRIGQAFDEVADFRPMVSFPVVRMEFKCVLSVYPRDPQDITVQATGSHIATNATDAEITNTTDMILEGRDAIGAAGMMSSEEARKEAELPIPTLRFNKQGAAYDEMVPSTKTEDEWTPPGVRGAVIDKGKNRL